METVDEKVEEWARELFEHIYPGEQALASGMHSSRMIAETEARRVQ